MGEMGSGPRIRSDRPLVEDCLFIDIRQFLRVGAGDGRARVLEWESPGREKASATCRLSGGRLMVLMISADATGGRRSLEVQERLDKEQAKNTDDTFGEIIRLNRELLAAREVRYQVPALQAAQVERDTLREERDRLAQEKALIEVALEQARANAKWSWRRQMKKAAQGGNLMNPSV